MRKSKRNKKPEEMAVSDSCVMFAAVSKLAFIVWWMNYYVNFEFANAGDKPITITKIQVQVTGKVLLSLLLLLLYSCKVLFLNSCRRTVRFWSPKKLSLALAAACGATTGTTALVRRYETTIVVPTTQLKHFSLFSELKIPPNVPFVQCSR